MAGRANAPAAMAPAPWVMPVMKRRRVTVSPSNAPGIWRSAVYFDLVWRRSFGNVVFRGEGPGILSGGGGRALCDDRHTSRPRGLGPRRVAGAVGGRRGGDDLGHGLDRFEIPRRRQL